MVKKLKLIVFAIFIAFELVGITLLVTGLIGGFKLPRVIFGAGAILCGVLAYFAGNAEINGKE